MPSSLMDNQANAIESEIELYFEQNQEIREKVQLRIDDLWSEGVKMQNRAIALGAKFGLKPRPIDLGTSTPLNPVNKGFKHKERNLRDTIRAILSDGKWRRPKEIITAVEDAGLTPPARGFKGTVNAALYALRDDHLDVVHDKKNGLWRAKGN